MTPTNRTDHQRASSLAPRPARRCTGDRGQTATIPAVMVITLVLLTLVVQTGLVAHARTVVDAAAADALSASQVEDGTEVDGLEAAERTLAGSRQRLLTDATVTVTRELDATTVRIEASVTRLVPLASTRVTVEITGPNERFRSTTP